MMPTSKAQMQSSMRYAKKRLKRIPLDVPNEKYNEIARHAYKRGETVNGFIKRAINEAMQRDLES